MTDFNEADNLEVAMAKVSENLIMGRKRAGTGQHGEPTQKQVIIRATERDHERWKQTAEIKGISLAEMVRELCNKAASEALDCQHPMDKRKSYPWAEICTKCNVRLRG
jgi:hypothetical protein